MMLEASLQEDKMQSNLVKAEAIGGDIVDSKIQDLEPIVVTAAIQFVINPVDNVSLQVEQLMVSATNTIVSAIEKHQHKKVIPIQRYVSTAHAAAYIDVDESFLTKRKGKTFKLGQHFFKPAGQSIVRWDIEALAKWLRSEESNQENITPKLANLLERS